MTRSGLVVVDKPGGITSHDVVARVRRALGTRKVGHAGTLDPMATGVLVLGVDRATRLLGHLAVRDKSYVATMRLGASTVTDDQEGEIVRTADPAALTDLTDAAIAEAVARLTGDIEQRPSAVSAIKVDGRRAYERVRSGEDVTLPTRAVHVESMALLRLVRGSGTVDLDVDVSCSTGTYVRAIARDLGDALGVGGHLTALRRTRVGPFEIDEALSLEQLAARGDDAVLPMPAVARRCFPTWTVDEPVAAAVRVGRRVDWAGPQAPGPVAVLDGAGDFLALATNEDGVARYVAVFA